MMKDEWFDRWEKLLLDMLSSNIRECARPMELNGKKYYVCITIGDS